MINIRKANERGFFDHGWLKTSHTFSFGDYSDPAHMHFRSLRVINEDWIAPGQGFGAHDHRDMEIITYMLEGELRHQDSMGNGSVIRAGEVQRMSAGTGVTHSEHNPSATRAARLLQMWIFPEKKGLKPGYEQKPAAAAGSAENAWVMLASANPLPRAVTIHQDASLWLARLQPGQELHYDLKPKRYAWLQMISGKARLNGAELAAGDGAAVSEESVLTVAAEEKSAMLLFDLS